MKRRRGVVAVVVVLSVLVVIVGGGLLGFRFYLRSDASNLNDPVWTAGQRLSPQPVNGDPKLVSYATAQVISERLRTELPLSVVGDPQYTTTFNFDPAAKRFVKTGPLPAGRIAVVAVRQSSSDAELANATTAVALFDQTANRDAGIATDLARGSDYRAEVIDHPTVIGATAVTVSRWSGSCVSTQGRTDSLIATAAVGNRTELRTSFDCVAPGDVERRRQQVVTLLGQAAGAVASLESSALPERVFDQTDRYPILSSGRWSDSQTTLPAQPTDQQWQVLPAPLRHPGVQLYYQAQSDVVVTADPAAAQAVLDDAGSWKVAADHPNPQTRPVTYADTQVCLPPAHPQEQERCLTRVGRFVIITLDPPGQPGAEAQAGLLQGIT